MSRLTFKLLLAMAVALAFPASAAAAPGSVLTVDHEDFGSLFMDASQSDPLDNTVNILPGETVTFSYPAGTNSHNVDFTALSPKPTNCVQTAGVIIPGQPIPPLPPFAQGPGWAGYCTFEMVGTYSFYCPVHPAMVGTVVVAPAQNQSPTVTASRTPSGDVTTATDVVFSAAGSDPDGDTLTYAWEFGDGGTSTEQNPTHRYTTPGTYTAKVTVSDGKGGTGETTLSVVVTQAANTPPTVTASRTPSGSVPSGTPVSFTASGSDPDGDTLTYAWDFGDGNTSTSQNPTHTYAADGTYIATVTVSDGRGGTGSASVEVFVGGNLDPVVTIDRNPPGNQRVGVPIEFTAIASDPDGDPLTYEWDFGGDATATGRTPTHTFLTVANHTVTVTVSDGRGGSATATTNVNIQANRNPVIVFATASPTDGIVPLPVSFDVGATDPDNHETTFEWDFDGDGTYDSTEQRPTFTYTTPGAYNAVVRVSDAYGGSLTRVIPVNALPATHDPADNYNVLLFTKTAGFRHSNIDEGITAIRKLGEENHFSVDAIEDASLFTDAFLARYDAVIFLSTTGDVLNADQEAAFERYIRAGGGYVGIHAAADSEYGWAWYGQLVGGYFRNHPPGTPTATVVREDATHHTTAHLPERWTRADEWYNYQGIVDPVVNGGGDDVSPRGLTPIHVLLTVDESTYTEQDGSDGVDDDHPISWCKRFDGGRMFYTGLAHTEASFEEDNFLRHLLGGIEIAAGFKADAACGLESLPEPTDEVDTEIGGSVSLVLGLSVSGAARFGQIEPGVTRDYTAGVSATVTSTAGSSTLTVIDPDTVNSGKLVNADYTFASPLEVRATNETTPGSAFAPLSNSPLTLLVYPRAVSNDTVALEFKQPISAADTLRAGSYGKTVVYTLAASTP